MATGLSTILFVVYGESWAGSRWLTNVLGRYYIIPREHRPILTEELAPSPPPCQASLDSWALFLYRGHCKWPPVLWKSLAQGLQLWGLQPGPELCNLWKELPSLFSPTGLSAEAMIASDLILRTPLELSLGDRLQYCGEKPTFPLSLKCRLTSPPQNAPRQEPWSLDKFTMRTQHPFFKGHQQTPSRERGDIFACTTLRLVLCGSSKCIADLLILHFHFFVCLPQASLLWCFQDWGVWVRVRWRP